MWTYCGKEFNPDEDELKDWVGFVYLLTDNENDKKYIGKKSFWRKITRPPLKGKKRKRRSIAESDWKDYYGSSEEVGAIVEEFGGDRFTREILHLCHSRGEMSYLELKEQVDRKALLREDYYNRIIQCRIHANHIKNLQKND